MKTIKSKISFGIGILFTVIMLLSISGIVFINNLAEKSKGTITENYTSVDYMVRMLTSLDNLHAFHQKVITGQNVIDNYDTDDYTDSKKIFEKNLEFETNNITEIGEIELVNQLYAVYRDYLNIYERLKTESVPDENNLQILNEGFLRLHSSIIDIYKLNMDAIDFKTDNLQTTADEVTIYMLSISAISILISLYFVFTFPSRIVGPLKVLTDKIKLISEKNYDQKLEINTNDEIGVLSKAFNTMAEKLRQYDAKQIDQYIFEQKRLAALMQSFEDGIVFINENKKIVIVNNTILQLIGLKEEQIINHPIQDVIKHNDLLREIYNSISIHKNHSTEIKPIVIVHNGKEHFFNIENEEIITYSESEQKETFIGNLILLRNVTKFQQRDKAKTNLLATVSHELKTPLSSINMCLKLLNDKRLGELNDKHKEVVQTLNQQSLRLSKVINELLEYSQIETGNIKLKFSNEKPDLIVDVGITALMMQISAKNIDLNIEIEKELPEIKVDVEKSVFVFVNILNNAIRYSTDGGRVDVKVKRINEQIEFTIKDYGPGITKEDQDKLFQKFSQVNKSSGWGLGLAISKEFLTAQNGKIWVESNLGEGSKFCFSLPISFRS